MPDNRRIVLFLDGTWNTVNDDTNVWRLKALCDVDSQQIAYYSKGVGTERGERLTGGFFGYGLDEEVIQAYQWLIEQYRVNDRIFIFGFSRGAFTARSLAGFISKCGLLKPGSPLSLRQLYARYRKGSTVHTIRELKNVADDTLSLEDRWLKKYSLPIPIYFQGVWDTVGALGVPIGGLPRLSRASFAFLETDLRINQDYAYHALAIDEHREAFTPTLWTKSVQAETDSYAPRSMAQVEQRWFVGAHSDVGGGYDNGLLAQLSLRWLMGKAASHGLTFIDTVSIDGDESVAEIHDSFGAMAGGLYRALKLWQPYYRTVGADPLVRGTTTTTPINETIDGSVFERWRRDPEYRPKNLQAWASRRRVAPESLRGSVRADDPTIVVED